MHDLGISVAVVVHSLFYTQTVLYSTSICMPYVQGGFMFTCVLLQITTEGKKMYIKVSFAWGKYYMWTALLLHIQKRDQWLHLLICT